MFDWKINIISTDDKEERNSNEFLKDTNANDLVFE